MEKSKNVYINLNKKAEKTAFGINMYLVFFSSFFYSKLKIEDVGKH